MHDKVIISRSLADERQKTWHIIVILSAHRDHCNRRTTLCDGHIRDNETINCEIGCEPLVNVDIVTLPGNIIRDMCIHSVN